MTMMGNFLVTNKQEREQNGFLSEPQTLTRHRRQATNLGTEHRGRISLNFWITGTSLTRASITNLQGLVRMPGKLAL